MQICGSASLADLSGRLVDLQPTGKSGAKSLRQTMLGVIVFHLAASKIRQRQFNEF